MRHSREWSRRVDRGRPLASVNPDQDGLRRALEFQRDTIALVAGEVRAIEEGWVARTPELPRVWSANQVVVTRPIQSADALALVERHLGDLPYRHLVIEHDASGPTLQREFREDGWKVERELNLVLSGPPDRAADTTAVIEADSEAALALMARWAGEDPELDLSAEDLDQVVEFSRRTWRARSARVLGMLGDDGELAAMTLVFSDGRTAQVEDVYTVPEARRRGFARALVTRAAEIAHQLGPEMVFIIADDNDWPKELYGKIGFEPVGRAWLFHREALP